MRQQVQNDRTAIRRCAQSSPKKKPEETYNREV